MLIFSGHLAPALAKEVMVGSELAGKCPARDIPKFRGGTVRLENDLFVGTDQNYTSGVGVTLVSHDISGKLRAKCLPAPVWLHAQLIQLLNPGFWADAAEPAVTQNVVAKFGQSMYTPEDYSRSDLIADDRPYAGLLYVGLAWNRRRLNEHLDGEVLDTRELTLGIIGPWSLAEQSQKVVHDAIGSNRFLGWEHQLRNEPALQVALDRKYKEFRGTGAILPGFNSEVIRSVGVRIGNIETSATMGIEGRLGWNLPNDFGSYPIRPGAENRPPSVATRLGRSAKAALYGVHFFGILEAKAIAWDFSLDGNLFATSHSVKRRPWVAQAVIGLSMQGTAAGHGYRLAVMRVHRTKEFEEQGVGQTYGSISLSVEF
ncbi:hypothetical protein AT746_17350 [Lacimicrobium alkaliphilum]|uniref:Uncharacterized protein n=2 Tax=Lacimicrobium alkaliphilum TaxID=1526571 RepID=A0A0U3B5M6_9ALTE|nr:hypothetical protein AT746_17350 [Lacimicrobium alkaliphilum]